MPHPAIETYRGGILKCHLMENQENLTLQSVQ